MFSELFLSVYVTNKDRVTGSPAKMSEVYGKILILRLSMKQDPEWTLNLKTKGNLINIGHRRTHRDLLDVFIPAEVNT